MKEKIKESIELIKEGNYTLGVELLQDLIEKSAEQKKEHIVSDIMSFHNFLMKEAEEDDNEDKSDDEEEDDKSDDDDKKDED